MPTDPLTKMRQAEFFEIRRRGLVLREVRGDIALHAFVGHLGRQAVGVGLERVARVHAALDQITLRR